jgi:hypothetical protein
VSAALDELIEGTAEAFTSLWSHSDGTVIMGADELPEKDERQR